MLCKKPYYAHQHGDDWTSAAGTAVNDCEEVDQPKEYLVGKNQV